MNTPKQTLQPWGSTEKQAWLKKQNIKRSYEEDVLSRITVLDGQYGVAQYGALSYNPQRYPLFRLTTRDWRPDKPTVLITGGVHGYETSGVHGALSFMQQKGSDYEEHFNLVCAPCVSPWGYETINRWNPLTLDPNRNFMPGSQAEESAALMAMVADLECPLLVHMDLHETTDTDNEIFRPDRAARDGVEADLWHIPDGFYTVGDTENPAHDFQEAIIASVRQVTHIAPPDPDGKLIGKTITQEGVINYDVKALYLCTGFSDAAYCTTTEVYPDSDKTTPEECVAAQVAAVSGGLDYVIGAGSG